MKRPILIFILLLIALSNCIDPYFLELDDNESLLVVEALVTDEQASYTIKISLSFQDVSSSPVMVSRAEVSVVDESGVAAVFQELEPGIYKSDSALFTGRVGGTYTLHIKTEDGLEYSSDACTMTGVPAIDSIYYEVDRDFFENGEVEEEGIRIYLDTDNHEEACQFFRWDFEEVWKFRVPYPIIHQDLGYKEYTRVPMANDFCWRYEQSKQILIHSAAEQNSEEIRREPIHFFASAGSNRLLKQYSIQVRQYSLSEQEFSFWENLREITESGGDIFERQPFPIEGNIRCINNEQVKVLGYFQVSAVSSRRIYIPLSQVKDLDIPVFEYPCERIIYRDRSLFERIYKELLREGYVLFWVEESEFLGPPISWQFTSAECADCSLTGKPERPDFWVDMD